MNTYSKITNEYGGRFGTVKRKLGRIEFTTGSILVSVAVTIFVVLLLFLFLAQNLLLDLCVFRKLLLDLII